MSSFHLHGRTALVTGSTQGIGLVTARALAEAGAHVVISCCKPDACAHVVARHQADGLNVEGRACHIERLEDIDAMAEHLGRQRQELDILVNNAVLSPGAASTRPNPWK